ncbi:MAG: hypothetical protein L0H70_01655, partial [Xanthomonadales bacterium]|nr:hypothetical protein [Xanthomonadales bacterium]
SYRVDDCLELVTSAGAAFQGWFFNAPYHAHETSAMGGGFQAALNALPTATQWSVMERLNADNACHFFMACHPQRAQSLSVTDFSSAGWLDTIPCLRMRCGLDEDSIFRPNWRMPLNPTQRVFAGLVDGQRSIREIIAQAAHPDRIQLDRREDMEIYARKLFQSLWRLDFIAMTRR